MGKDEFTKWCDEKNAWLQSDEYFDSIEQSILSPSPIGFGNPDSKLTAHEQFLLWKRWQKQPALFENRDEFCNTMLLYSSFEQAQQHFDCLCQSRQVKPLHIS